MTPANIPRSRETKKQSLWARLVWGKRPVWTVFRLLLLIVTCLFVFKFVLCPIRVSGRSMEPTFYDGQIGVINLLAYHGKAPLRADIIAFRQAPDPHILIKRVIGLPGEQIAFHSGVVSINGNPIDEPYLTSLGAWEWPEETLGDNVYFVTGDNRTVSQQYRVQRGEILGKVHIRRR